MIYISYSRQIVYIQQNFLRQQIWMSNNNFANFSYFIYNVISKAILKLCKIFYNILYIINNNPGKLMMYIYINYISYVQIFLRFI